MTLTPNSRFGSYVITNKLGVGISSEVYRCQDTVHGRDVALKILQPEFVGQEETMVSQFHQEALIIGSLRHPNIIEGYDSGIENGVHYIAFEFLDGRPLSGPVAAPEFTAIAAQVAAGITALHNAGIVHNDVKPGNLIITTDGRVKIIDFGIAQKFTREMAADPLQLAEWRRRVWLDQLSFGLALYELATGKVPFEDPETARTMAELLGGQLLHLPPETQLSLQDAVRHCAVADGSHAGLMLTAMSVALALAGAPSQNPEM
jgi:eukaryotic-like serine/threonine-protein kinase